MSGDNIFSLTVKTAEQRSIVKVEKKEPMVIYPELSCIRVPGSYSALIGDVRSQISPLSSN